MNWSTVPQHGRSEALDHAAEQPVVRRQEQVALGLDDGDVARAADARIHHGDVHGAAGKVANDRPSQKPASAGQCASTSCVRSTIVAAGNRRASVPS